MLRNYAASPLGRSRIESLAPRSPEDRAWMEQQLRLTEEVRAYWRTGGRFEFAGLTDLAQLLAKARIEDAVLDPLEIRDVLAVVERAEAWRAIGLAPPSALRDGWPEVDKLTRRIVGFASLLKWFHGKLLPDGTLDDKASLALARIRREIEQQKRQIQQTLRAHLRRLSDDGAVQDELITIRGERFVIPVKTEQRRKVQGVMHGASSSGQTVFVEPMETIEQNNELVRLFEEELSEIRRILAEMTAQIGARAAEIHEAVAVLAELELQFAKARFAEDFDCVPPRFTGGDLRLRQAVHPVLERNLRAKKRHVVPMSLEMAAGARQLIISGPNTGGKTVALKSVGLLALMAQTGMPVPAAEALLPLFDAVLADIGDAQSIAQDLSTFSSHITRIHAMAQAATRHSLVLLDELGSATDPEEGAALAVAIAGHFRASHALTLISTHHTSLKVYAANTEGVVNASVGFDETTLQPTYQMRVGVPGASAGLNIAQQLGLDARIIADARTRLSSQTQDISRFLDRLHEDLKQVEHERADLSKKSGEVERERSRLEKLGLEEQRAKVRGLEKKFEELFNDLTYQMREAVSAVQERSAQQRLTKDAERRMAKLRREFKEQFDSTVVAHRSGADVNDPKAPAQPVAHLFEGDVVRLKSLGRDARITRRLSDDLYEVEAGGLKMKVTRSDVASVSSTNTMSPASSQRPVEAARSRGINVKLSESSGAAAGVAAGEINVIGKTVDEATEEVERFLDRAFLAGLPRVRIVHGHGMGILRKALRQFLKSHPHVGSFTEPPQNEGGAGATVVELNQ